MVVPSSLPVYLKVVYYYQKESSSGQGNIITMAWYELKFALRTTSSIK